MAKLKNRKMKKVKGSSKYDPQGSYTGVCSDDCYEKPTQDADDL